MGICRRAGHTTRPQSQAFLPFSINSRALSSTGARIATPAADA
jgi:hypothetical protein